MKLAVTLDRSVTSLLITGVIVLVLGGLQFWLWPWVGRTVQELEQFGNQQEQAEELKRRLYALQQEYAEARALVEQLTVILPQADQTTQIISQLEQLAQQQFLTLTILNITEEKAEHVVPFIMKLQAKGEAANVLNYLHALEHVPLLVEVRHWSLFASVQAGFAQPSDVPVSDGVLLVPTLVTSPLPSAGSAPSAALYTLEADVVVYFQPVTPQP